MVEQERRATMSGCWREQLVWASRRLRTLDCPIWWDGFHNVLARGETSSDDDNLHSRSGKKGHAYKAYKAGAKAAESLKRALVVDERGY